jgi:flagellar secretion chaperone FliS
MVPHSPAASRYREVAVKTATPLQLVVMLYDGAIQALQEAQQHIGKRNIAGRSQCVNKSVALISELQACLNFEEGAEIAVSLNRLYNYMKQRIFSGNVEQSAEPLAEVAGLLENLRGAWQQLASQSLAGASRPVPPSWPSIEGLAPERASSLNISG